jgi:hypothetical protein
MQDHNFPQERHFQKRGFLEGRIALQILTTMQLSGRWSAQLLRDWPQAFLAQLGLLSRRTKFSADISRAVDRFRHPQTSERLFLHIIDCTHQPPVEPGISTISDLHGPLRVNPMETLLPLTRTQSRHITGRNG